MEISGSQSVFERIAEPLSISARVRLAVTNTKIDCRRKEETSVLRRRGVKSRWRREKKKEPSIKLAIDTTDFTQPRGSRIDWPVELPIPMKMVLPVCIDTKVP